MAQTVTLRWPSSFLSTPTPRDAGKSNNTNKVENKESERYESVARHSRDEHRVAIYGGSGEIQKALLQASEKKRRSWAIFWFSTSSVPHIRRRPTSTSTTLAAAGRAICSIIIIIIMFRLRNSNSRASHRTLSGGDGGSGLHFLRVLYVVTGF